ncbi:MAG: hypothetical protein SFU86_11595, partial [Pirellulaceae bacterium]|nr:hypothetical protein [Pirellulaceae bacterium]
MRILTLSVLAVIAVAIPLAPARAQYGIGGDCNLPAPPPIDLDLRFPDPRCDAWLLATDFLSLQIGSAVPLVSSQGPTGPSIDRAHAGDHNEPGLRATLGRSWGCGIIWEATYFGLNTWSQTDTVFGDSVNQTFLVTSPNLIIDDIIGGFDDFITFRYRSQLHNAELNRRRVRVVSECWSLSTLFGTRYIHFSEDLFMRGEDITFSAFEELTGRSRNDMIGGQLGIRAVRHWAWWQARVGAKAGLFANLWEQRLFDEGDAGTGGGPSGVLQDVDEHGCSVAALLEMDASLSYKLRENLFLRGGYQLTYLVG